MMKEMLGGSPATEHDNTPGRRRGTRAVGLGVAATAAIALFLGGMGATASADTEATDTGTINATVNVESGVALTLTEGTLTLTGAPGDVREDTVHMNVLSNSTTGYSVTVKAGSASLSPFSGGTAAVNVNHLKVASADNAVAVPGGLSDTAQEIHHKEGLSGVDGDDLMDTYTIKIPSALVGAYTATLTYVVAPDAS